MNKKIFENSRICPKGDIEANWNKAVGFIPLDKEIIIYKKDETHSAARFKVGDGKTVVQELPFSGTDIEAIEKLIDEKGELLIEYVDNAVAALPQADWSQNDETAKDYIKNRPFYTYSKTYSESDYTLVDSYTYRVDEHGNRIIYDYNYLDWRDFSSNENLNIDTAKIICTEIQVIVLPDMRREYKYETFEISGKLALEKHLIYRTYYRNIDNWSGWVCRFDSANRVDLQGGGIRVSSIITDEIRQIDEKYIPDTIAPQTDWNQNDTVAKDYLKNRPFHDEFETFKPLKTYAFDGVLDGKEYFTIGDGYFVKISNDILGDGEYVCDAVLSDGEVVNDSPMVRREGMLLQYNAIVIVITDIQLAEEDMGIIAPSTGTYVMYHHKGYTSQVTFKEVQVIALKPIDEKFIPDTIARVKDLNSIIQTATKDNILSIFN